MSAYWTSRTTLAITLAFLVGAFIPGFRLFTDAVMNGVSFTFEFVTGKSPYAWLHARNHISNKVIKALEESGGKVLDLREMSAGYQWDSVCVFGPNTSDEEATKVLNLSYEWKLSQRSKAMTSDGISTLVFLFESKNRGVSYVVDLTQSQADFAKLSGRCFSKPKAHFVKMEGQGLEWEVSPH